MRCGLYGKLPAKRDFVALSAPRGFLRVWEPWLDKGMADSRARMLPEAWKEAFCSAPIWRFWLGAELCGEAIVGAFMPSMDALGRAFPLTLIGAADDGRSLAPPDVDPRELWFERAEEFLLAALDCGTAFETTMSALAGLAAEARQAPDQNEPRAAALIEIFADLRRERRDCPAAGATFWWTAGGTDCEPLAFMQKFMPAPAAFTDMLTVRLRDRPRATLQLG
jgi:type VI secretion system protein ImpM